MEAIMDMFGVKKYNPYKKKLLREFSKEYLLRWYVIFGITLLAFISGIFVDPSRYFIILIASVIPTSFYSVCLHNVYDKLDRNIAGILVLLILIGSWATIIATDEVYQKNKEITEIWILYARVWAAIPLLLSSFLLFKRLLEIENELRNHGKGKARAVPIYRFIKR